MDGWPKVALVATPDVGATVLYDFNTTLKAYAGHDGLDTGHPEWRGEPGAQGGSYDYRTIRFTHYIDGTDAAATAAMATLSRLLMADYGWLLIQQRSGAAPTWAKAWRSSPSALSWDGIRLDAGVVKGKYGIDVTLTADPFLMGEKITLANAVTVNNDPAFTGTELLTANQSGSETDGTAWTGSGGVTAGRGAAQVHSGSWAMEANWSGGGGSPTVSLASAVTGLTIGTRYTFTAWVRPTTGPAVALGISGIGTGSPGGVAGVWTMLSFSFTATATSHTPIFVPSSPSSAGFTYQDDMSLKADANPCRLVLGTVLGDAPAPLEVKADPSLSLSSYFRWMLALHAGDTQRLPVVWQFGTGDGFTAGADTGAAVADSAYSGGSYRPVTFATNTTLVNRLSGNVPSVLSSARYKVLCRVGFGITSGDATFRLRFGGWDGSQYLYQDTKFAPDTTSNRVLWVDMGEFTFPPGVHPDDAAKGNAVTPAMAIQAARPSGTGEMRLDCVMLVPIDAVDCRAASTLFTNFDVYSIGTGTGTWDAETERFFMLTSGGDSRASMVGMAGGFPHAAPGASNVLTVLQAVDSVAGIDDISGSTAVTVTYRPRWLWPAL